MVDKERRRRATELKSCGARFDDEIADSTWHCGDPGMQYALRSTAGTLRRTRRGSMHRISAVSTCSWMDTACNLASLN